MGQSDGTSSLHIGNVDNRRPRQTAVRKCGTHAVDRSTDRSDHQGYGAHGSRRVVATCGVLTASCVRDAPARPHAGNVVASASDADRAGPVLPDCAGPAPTGCLCPAGLVADPGEACFVTVAFAEHPDLASPAAVAGRRSISAAVA